MSKVADPDARAELAELARAVRAHVEWLVASGAAGTPRAERSPAHVEQSAPPVVAVPAVAPPKPVIARPAPAELTPPAPAPLLTVPTLVRDEPVPNPAEASATKPVVLEPAERLRRLDVLAETVRSCTRCALHADRTQTVFARGTGASRLCFVGEGPGADEDAQGFPFVGKAGQLLDRMIEAMGFARDEVYVCNIVKCRPPNNRKPEPEEMAACMPYLREQLELVTPEVIVALGATALQGLFGTTEGITRLRGRWKLYGGRVPVMPTFHPAFLLRNPAAKREVWEDLQAVLRQMGRQPPKR
ncbi:MAG TPA: uracil-DNA glycosylase [Polyangiaceae bacterium]|nr:uracil-DNA glycosylase [Polyangiaceae bacterium]